ncbi:MAG TPA: hypothetical protein VK680_13010 [Solirubrobacteraceae bacterium]|nr:hypothetical protein [Solirubrobacteraceae bacterium]
MATPIQESNIYGDPMVWALQPGEAIERTMLHERYGGRKQGGIGPSRLSPNVLVFSDPAAGEPHGYFDGWRADGCFHYTGEGQRGDQEMKSGNAAILNSDAEGRALRLFLGARGRVTYEGRFGLAPDRPFYTTDAPETGGGPTRNVIVFRMLPLDIQPRRSSSRLDLVLVGGSVEDVPVEEQWTEKVFVAPSRKEYEAERREQKLVLAFREYLVAQGHEVSRLKIVPPGEAKPLFTDLFDRTTNTLYEAKGSVERGAIRMAIGQLSDYGRFVQPAPRRAVLLPSRPREDLCELLTHAGVELLWKDGKRFMGTPT